MYIYDAVVDLTNVDSRAVKEDSYEVFFVWLRREKRGGERAKEQ